MKLLSRIFLFTLITMLPVAKANDAGSDEALFINTSESDMFCYGDAGGTDYLCQIKVSPGESCRGDAIGGHVGSNIYKAPNGTKWNCSFESKTIECNSDDLKSSLKIIAAFAVRGFDEYYEIGWSEWIGIMGQKAIRKCTKDYKSISNEIWAPEGHECKEQKN